MFIQIFFTPFITLNDFLLILNILFKCSNENLCYLYFNILRLLKFHKDIFERKVEKFMICKYCKSQKVISIRIEWIDHVWPWKHSDSYSTVYIIPRGCWHNTESHSKASFLQRFIKWKCALIIDLNNSIVCWQAHLPGTFYSRQLALKHHISVLESNQTYFAISRKFLYR